MADAYYSFVQRGGTGNDGVCVLMHVRIFIYLYLKTMLTCTLHDTGVCRIFCMVYSYILRVFLMRVRCVYL